MSWSNRRVLVTGGTGFIGAGICKSLLAAGAEVVSLDNSFRGSERRLPDHPRLKKITADIRDLPAVMEATKGADTVFHLAFINGTEHFYKRPGEIIDIAMRGMMNVADAAKAHGVSTMFLASSSEVYQSPPVVPTPEDVPLIIPDITNPRYSYGGGKIIWELVGMHMLPAFVERTIIFRPHNVYGPDMGWEHVIPQLVKKIHGGLSADGKKSRIEIQGDGSQTRAFIYIDDFVDALMVIDREKKAAGRVPEIFHVGSEDEVTISDILNAIASKLDVSLQISHGPAPQGGTLRRCPSTKKLRGLGFECKFGLKEGLGKTVEWYWRAIAEGMGK